MNYGWFNKLNGRVGHYFLLAAAAGALFFWNLGAATLWDLDEGRNATAAYEMLQSGKWIVPTFNGELRVDKPPLLYWWQILAYRWFGINEFAARLPSAVAGLLTLLVCYELGRRLFDASTGLLTGLIAASTPMQVMAARFANPDALLNLCTCLFLLVFWVGLPQRRTRWWGALGIISGLAVLAKGPIGLLLPGGVVLLFLFWTRRLWWLWDRRLMLALAAFAVTALPWYLLVAVETKGEFLRGFLLTHNLNRFLESMETHGHGPWYYLVVVFAGTAPWSIFLPWAGLCGLLSTRHVPASPLGKEAEDERSLWPADQGNDGARPVENYRFLMSWIAVFLVFYSFSATKLPNYILPVLVPLAVLLARFLVRWQRTELSLPGWVMPACLIVLALIGLMMSLAILLISGQVELAALHGRHVPGLAPWCAVGAIPILGCLVCLWLGRNSAHRRMLVGLTATNLLFMLPITTWIPAALNQVKAPQPLIELAQAHRDQQEVRLACFQLQYLPSLNFYSRREVALYRDEQQAIDFLNQPWPVFLFTPTHHWQQLAPKVATPFRVLAQHPDIYRGKDVLVVTNR